MNRAIFVKFFCLYLIVSVLLSICEFEHVFCKVDQFSLVEIVHSGNHHCENHHCSASEEEHSHHARHYDCCDSEEPHDHPVRVPATNADNYEFSNADVIATAMPQTVENIGVLFESKLEKVSQRLEETYELLLCNNTVVLTI